MTFTNIDAGAFSFNTASSAPPPHVISFVEGSWQYPGSLEKLWSHMEVKIEYGSQGQSRCNLTAKESHLPHH